MFRRVVLATGVILLGASGCASKAQPTVTEPGSGGPSAPSPSSASPTSPVPTPGGHNCPRAITPTTDAQGNVHDVVIDYADVLHFNGHDYQSVDDTPVEPAALGASLGHVVCTLSASHIDPAYLAQDGDATFVPVGSPIYAVQGSAADRELAAEHDGVMHRYRALPPG